MRNDWKWLCGEFVRSKDDIAKAKQELSAMKQFMEGSGVAVKWREIREFFRTQFAEAKDLGIPLVSEADALDAAQAVVDDPECYRSREIPRASATIKRAKEEISKAKSALRLQVLGRLAEYRASFEESYDMDAMSEDAREKFFSLFSNAEAVLSEEDSAYRIQSFFEVFKRDNGEELLRLVSAQPSADVDPGKPPKELPTRKTVSIGGFAAHAYKKPTIESNEDVDSYLEALGAELKAEIANGSVIMR